VGAQLTTEAAIVVSGVDNEAVIALAPHGSLIKPSGNQELRSRCEFLLLDTDGRWANDPRHILKRLEGGT
jgi:hypothetical protein